MAPRSDQEEAQKLLEQPQLLPSKLRREEDERPADREARGR